ncbi:MAG: hypothetical protein K0U61_13280, partial [Alphaproteobacteria bacterium]|nr:hypothetical protein [Alphaproteobacteria bacterium]
QIWSWDILGVVACWVVSREFAEFSIWHRVGCSGDMRRRFPGIESFEAVIPDSKSGTAPDFLL